MSNKATNTDPFPSNEGEYLVMVNELKKQFDEEKAKWTAKFTVLEKQNKEMRNFIKKINNVTDEIVKSDNKRLFDEIDEGSNSNPRPRRRRRRRRVRLVRNDGTEMTEVEREFYNFLMHSLENQSEQPVTEN
jgi:hypothetical protein